MVSLYLVRKLSNQGACLQLPSTGDLSAEFDLSFDTWWYVAEMPYRLA